MRDATRLIAPLQQGVLAWTDADRVVPAEGSFLLAALERTLEGLTAENALAARAGIEAFIGRVEALIEAGLLEVTDGHSPLEAAAALAALLPGAEGSDTGIPEHSATTAMIQEEEPIMNSIRDAAEGGGSECARAPHQSQAAGGREKSRAPHLRALLIAALALLAGAGRVAPALAATGAGALAQPMGSKPHTGGILNSQFWKVQAGDTIMAKITGAKDARPDSGANVPVLIRGDPSLLGSVTVAGTLTGTTVTFTWPYSMGPSCGIARVAYWGGSATGFITCNSALINGTKTTPAGWVIVDTAGNLVGANPLTGRCYPPLGGVQCPLTSGLLDCASGSSKTESFSFSPGGITGGQPPYTVTASATNGVTLSPAGGYPGITLASNGLGFVGTFPVGQTTVTITVTDGGGAATQCSFPVTIDHPTVTVANAAICAGSSATLTAQTSGGNGPYSFSWTGPSSFTATGQTISVSAAGQYTVTVTDSSGCSGQGSGTLTVRQPPAASISGQTNVSCYGGNSGSATVAVTGGASPYQVSDGTTTRNGAGPFTFSNLAAKSYNYSVIDANGCTASTSVTITQPGQLIASSAAGTILCSGGSTTVTVSASGGMAPYTGTGTFTVAAGPYSFTVTDQNGCTATTSGTITQPSRLVASSSAGTILCNGGSAMVLVNAGGGTPPYSGTGSFSHAAGSYSYTVTDASGCTVTTSGTLTEPPLLIASASAGTIACHGGATTVTVSASGGAAPYTGTGTFTVGAGPYSYTVTDANGCTATTSGTITQPAQLIASSAVGTIACAGGSTTVTVSASGGTGPYTGTGTFTVSAGPYSYTITDASGCTATTSGTITAPNPLTVSATQTNVSTASGSDGNATAAALGGTGPYSYSWSTNPVQTTATASGLAAGSYSVTVTDAHGCTASTSVAITQPATAPPLTVSITGQANVSCNGRSDGNARAAASGGTGPYNYLWNTIPAQIGDTATGLTPGPYTVTAIDTSGSQATATVIITQPARLTVGISIVSSPTPTCLPCGWLQATASGGTGPYSYLWSNGQPVALATGLRAGTYTVTVTDAHGCTASSSTTITQPATPQPLTVSVTDQTNPCSGGSTGSATAAAAGGTGPYSYSWNTTQIQTTATATGLATGTYTVTATDASGATATATVTITQPAPLTVTITEASPPTSCDLTGGELLATVSGGTGQYSYSWSNGETTNLDLGLVAGNYSVTVTDTNGCTATASMTLFFINVGCGG